MHGYNACLYCKGCFLREVVNFGLYLVAGLGKSECEELLDLSQDLLCYFLATMSQIEHCEQFGRMDDRRLLILTVAQE